MEPIKVPPVFLMYAFRYALGRMSYAVSDVADVIRSYADTLPIDWRTQIVRDIRQAVADGRAGMDMDARRWAELADELETPVVRAYATGRGINLTGTT